ncbi:uncharacterized protein si:ch211-106h4.12 isoform X3 [Labeo rohita]|uniref:uncharacterized protein si:ch211-106h4.12 isoform X3 n=1 Tax=Labeo rohita TaxID=84645 RepID=UPI0021E2E48F|nr:uncharacterized protein si:ch211-106h4.12 isoform X3 [Labeo rohita]
MKSTVQIGLLCLSLLISSLCGEEVDGSMETPLSFDEPDLEQFEMYRVRRQAVSTKENTANIVAAGPSGENNQEKRKRPRPNNNGKPRIGSRSALESLVLDPPPQQTVEVKRDAEES